MKRDDLAVWNVISGKEDDARKQKEMLKIAAFQQWEHAWNNNPPKPNTGHRAPADPEIWHAANIITDDTTGRQRLNYKATPTAIHQHLSRAQSSIATSTLR